VTTFTKVTLDSQRIKYEMVTPMALTLEVKTQHPTDSKGSRWGWGGGYATKK